MKKPTPSKDQYKGMTPNTQQRRPNTPMTTKPVQKFVPSKGTKK